MESGPGLAAQPRPQQDRTASVIRGDKDEQQQMSMHRHFFSINGARHKRGARREYIKLALEALMGDAAAGGGLGSG